jgi:hypothetical protein
LKYNRLHTAFLIVSLAFIGLMVDSCKSKKQEIPPFIDVHLEVKDANNVPSTGATAYLYNSQEAFQTAYQNSLNLKYSSAGSILTTTIVNGVVDLKGLPSNTEYWILVHDTSSSFIDPISKLPINGYKVDKDNSEAYYKIDGFQNGTTVLANITLQPVSSLIKFDNNSGVSQVRLNDDPNLVSIPQQYLKVRKGNIGYQARNTTCVWTGEINAEGGMAVSESLVVCNERIITFRTNGFNLLQGESIKVYVGQNKASIQPLAELTFGKNTETLILDNGTGYTYFAEFFTGTTRRCVYEGVIGNGTVTVPLDQCR